MSRKNKAYRAWRNQNDSASTKDAWDAAWANKQNQVVSLKHKEQQARIAELEAALESVKSAVKASGSLTITSGCWFKICETLGNKKPDQTGE